MKKEGDASAAAVPLREILMGGHITERRIVRRDSYFE